MTRAAAEAAYEVWDVFTDRPFAGNPLAVVLEGASVPSERMQAAAREFGFSETTFVLPPRSGGHARVRIFTPTQEVPFAGHPTIGTALALKAAGGPEDMTLELGIGPVPVRVAGGIAAFVTTQPLEVLGHPSRPHAAACLGLAGDDIAGDPVIASVGLPFCLVPLASEDALVRARPVIDAFREAERAYPLPFDFAIYAWHGAGEAIEARMFAPLDDIPEDPATGSAAAALAAWRGADRLTIRQGVRMGRPSVIEARRTEAGTEIAGGGVRVMAGRLFV